MRISFALAAALGTISGLSKVEVYDDEGNRLFFKDSGTPSAVTPQLNPLYETGEQLEVAVIEAEPMYQVWADSDNGPKLTGSGDLLPPIRYGSNAKTGILSLMNPGHPYFAAAPVKLTATQASSIAIARPSLEKALADVSSGKLDATKLWETVESTLPPGDMSFLLHWMGYTVDGKSPLEQSLAYRTWYYKHWGKQAPHPAPRNPEADWITDAELAAIRAS